MAKNQSNGIDLASLTGSGASAETGSGHDAMREAHEAEFRLAMSDIWYFARHVITFDEENKKFRPFPHDWPYLIRVNAEIEEHRRVIVLKARRLLISWLGMLRMLHKAKGANTGGAGVDEVFSGAIMSIGETEAAHLIERISSMHESLPDWLRNRNPIVINNQMQIRFANGGDIKAFPLKRQGPRTFGFTEVFFDEMAFQDAVRTVWAGMIPTLGAGGIVTAVSTPNGKGNLFYDIWANKNDRYSAIHRIKLYVHDNPEHDEWWLKGQAGSMAANDIEREYHHSFSSYQGEAVWDTFDRKTHLWNLEETPLKVDESLPIYIGYDLGFHFPAATVWQRNSRDQWIGFMEYQGYDIGFDDFCDVLKQKLNTLYRRNKVQEIHCMPPDAKIRYSNRAVSGAANDVAQVKLSFAKMGVPPQVRFCPPEVGTRDNEAPRLKVTRSLFKLRADGNPGIVISPDMTMFVEGCGGGYCYQMTGNTEVPDKNEHSHLQDSGQSVFSAFSRMMTQSTPPEGRRNNDNRPRIGHRTGM